MPLDANQTREVLQLFTHQVFAQARHKADVNTDDLEVAVAGVVVFIEANTVAINNALPEPFKSVATTQQKRHLVGLVAAKLAGIV